MLPAVRWAARLTFLAFFALLTFRAAYPPITTPAADLMLRLDPLAGVYSLITTRSASTAAAFWPAWVLLGLTALSSRFFCGWICPLGTCFDAAGACKPEVLKYYRPKGKAMKAMLAQEKKGASPRRLRLKYLILAAVLGLGLAGVNLLYFASPLAVMNRSLYLLFLPQVPVLLVLMVLLAFVYRPRFWCEELCPMGALMSLVSMAGKRLRSALSPLSVVKDPGACVECGACFRACGFGVWEPYLKQEGGRLRSADCTACGDCVAACPSGGALALQSFGLKLYASRGVRRHPAFERRRGADSSGAGPTASQGAGSSVAGVRADAAGPNPAAGRTPEPRLTVSRREFVGSIGLGAVLLAGYGAGVREVSGPVLRMPGAQDEFRFLAECNRCGECMRACPVGCIKPMGLEGGLQKLWTPRFEPRTAGCIYDQCGQACAHVCPAAAIERQKPEEVRIGVARITRRTCLGWIGEPCLVCQERCRFDAISNNGLRPFVDEDACTGCGACEETCPTGPTSIKVFTLGNSRSVSSGSGGSIRGRGGR